MWDVNVIERIYVSGVGDQILPESECLGDCLTLVPGAVGVGVADMQNVGEDHFMESRLPCRHYILVPSSSVYY